MSILVAIIIFSLSRPVTIVDWETIRVNLFLENEESGIVIVVQVSHIKLIWWLFDLLCCCIEPPVELLKSSIEVDGFVGSKITLVPLLLDRAVIVIRVHLKVSIVIVTCGPIDV